MPCRDCGSRAHVPGSASTAEPKRRSRQRGHPVARLALTRQEAASTLGISIDSFERYVQPFVKVVPCGQLVLVPIAELERWVRERARLLVADAG